MKRLSPLIILFFTLVNGHPATTIDAVNKYAWGANLGWMDWTGGSANGAVMGQYVCSGYIYSADIGWIDLGSGAPANGIYYQNNAANDYGVNQDGAGNLRGYAYGANIGWINFESNGSPRIDLVSGRLTGSIYSANCGWISLSNAVAYVQTDGLSPGPVGTNGLPIAWQLTYFGATNVDPNADPDGDGMSNQQEYVAGTDPLIANSALRISAFDLTPAVPPNPPKEVVTWSSTPTRLYYLEVSSNLVSWTDSGLGVISPDGSNTTRTLNASGVPGYLRVRAVLPLSP